MPFNIDATETPTATSFFPDLHRHLGPANLGACVRSIGIRHHDTCGLRLAASDFIRLLHQTAKLRFFSENKT